MLVRFSVGNFLSFNSVQEFSMIGGMIRSKSHHVESDGTIKLLKFGAVFGANASGKSNMVKAMNFAQSLIINGIDGNFSTDYFRFDDANSDKPSYFEFEIKIKEKYYAYGFEILLQKSELVSEWLHELSPHSDTVIFERNLAAGSLDSNIKFNQPETRKRMDVYSNDIKKLADVFFLNEMNRNKDELYKEKTELSVLRDVYHWFKNNLDINYPDRPISNYSYFHNELDAKHICKIIKAFGTGITNFKIVKTTIEEMGKLIPKEWIKMLEHDINKLELTKRKSQISHGTQSVTVRVNDNIFIIRINENMEREIHTIVFEHGNQGTIFKLSEESDGTRRILDLIEILMADDHDRVYVIDEIDRSLHPQLTYKFIESFLSLAKNRRNQLIVTTHESRLLDFDLLRRDEIWFVNKGEQGDSTIYSLDAYNERFDKKIDKAYLEGRYGGVPLFSSIFPVGEKIK